MTPGGTAADIQLTGTVFLDMVFTGLAAPPGPGREVRASSLGVSPGGVANLAIALSRLGLRVRLDAAFGRDANADYLWRTIGEQEGVDVSGSVRFDSWTTPITVSLAYQADRSMITYEERQPAPPLEFLEDGRPLAAAVFAYLGAQSPTWLPAARAAGVRIFADVGWDETEQWNEDDLLGLAHVDAFMPNCDEAMAYTRTESPEAAAKALSARVPLVVVKCGCDGAIAWRAGDAEPIVEPAIRVDAVDPTGAGDVFDGAFTFGLLAGWDLRDVLRFANLCAGLSVRHYGGSLSAPTWGEVAEWVGSDSGRADAYGCLEPYFGLVAEGGFKSSSQRVL